RSLEANSARARPGDHVSIGVRDRDDRVVERRLNVGVAVVHHALLAALLERLLLFRRRLPGFRCRAGCAFGLIFFGHMSLLLVARGAPPPLARSAPLLRRGLRGLLFTQPSSSQSRPSAAPCACASWSASAGRAP